MKREELIAYDKWLTRRKWGTGEIISPEKAADLYLAEHPLPPAEGAEETAQRCPVCGGNGLVTNGFYNQTSGYWSTSSISPETCRTCNGTGVILPSYLHAQKIADKMVSEMLREELIKYDRWMSGNYWGVKQIPTPEQSVDEYLKSRER
jgi:hypothetical protein